MGTVGINVLDIDTVLYLTISTNPGEVVSSQVQTMGRGNRFPFKGMRGHEQMRQQINSLNIPLTQKYALSQYVVHKCETHIFTVRTSFMETAYEEYAENTMTHDEGLQYYMSHMTPDSYPYIKPIAKPHCGWNYDASALNRTYKKYHCEYCKIIDQKGTTECEQLARTEMEKAKGQYDDSIWADIWFKVLQVHHKDGNHLNYDLTNLITTCPNMHMTTTIIEGHAKNRYN